MIDCYLRSGSNTNLITSVSDGTALELEAIFTAGVNLVCSVNGSSQTRTASLPSGASHDPLLMNITYGIAATGVTLETTDYEIVVG